MKVGFVTCVRLGLDCIEEIDALGGRLDVVVTLVDEVAAQKSGRTYLDDFCERQNVSLLKVRQINEDWLYDDLRSRELDWLFIVGWSQLVQQRIIDAPRSGCIGMHPTLLPQGRGRAPIPWAILKSLDRTGVTAFRIAGGTDDGPICAQIVVPVAERETATTLYDKICDAHRQCIRDIWPKMKDGSIAFVRQNEDEATYWPQRRPQDGELMLSMSVADVDRMVRAVTRPYPGAWLRQDRRVLRIWSGYAAPKIAAATDELTLTFSDGAYIATEFEWEAAAPITVKDGTKA